MAEWPDDKVTDMVSMRQRGWTATQIGKALNMSRNAIIGKLDRLGLIRRRHDRPTATPIGRAGAGWVSFRPRSRLAL